MHIKACLFSVINTPKAEDGRGRVTRRHGIQRNSQTKKDSSYFPKTGR